MKEITMVGELPEDFMLDYSGSDSWQDLISLCPELEECSYAYVLSQDGDYIAIYGHYGNNLTPYLENTLELLYPNPKYDRFITSLEPVIQDKFKKYGHKIFNSYFLDFPVKGNYEGGYALDMPTDDIAFALNLFYEGYIMIRSVSPLHARYELKV